MITRTCNDCGEDKVLEDLAKAKGCLHGRRKLCKACSVKRGQVNVDKATKASYDKDRRSKKGDELRAYDKERSKHPHRKAAHAEETRRRRLAVKQQTPEWASKEDILCMYELAVKLNKLTGSDLQVDHIIPLRGQDVSGLHTVENLQLLDAKLNNSKRNKQDYQLSWAAYPA